MNKYAIAAALLSSAIAVPAAAQDAAGEARAEVRGGLITGIGSDEATFGAALGYDFDLGDKAFAGVEVAGDKVLVDGADVQFSAGGRLGTRIGDKGKLYAAAGYTFSDIDDIYAGAGYQHQLGTNVYAKAEWRHQFIDNFSDYDTFAVGVGFKF